MPKDINQKENKKEEEKTEKKADNLKVEKNAKEGKLENSKKKKPAKGGPAFGGKAKKIKRQILKGRATIKCSYNNTMINIADPSGNILGWATSGLMGFKGAKKATPYAATQVVASISEKVKKYGMRELEVFVKGVGSGREASVRALANNGFDLISIKDITPIPHNGCRPKKPRRV